MSDVEYRRLAEESRDYLLQLWTSLRLLERIVDHRLTSLIASCPTGSTETPADLGEQALQHVSVRDTLREGFRRFAAAANLPACRRAATLLAMQKQCAEVEATVVDAFAEIEAWVESLKSDAGAEPQATAEPQAADEFADVKIQPHDMRFLQAAFDMGARNGVYFTSDAIEARASGTMGAFCPRERRQRLKAFGLLTTKPRVGICLSPKGERFVEAKKNTIPTLSPH